MGRLERKCTLQKLMFRKVSVKIMNVELASFSGERANVSSIYSQRTEIIRGLI